MKSIIAILCIACLCSCSVFRKQQKTETNSQTEIKQGSTSEKNETDTSKAFFSEKIKITFPSIINGKVAGFNGWPALNNGTEDLRNATVDLQDQVKAMMAKYDSSGKQVGDYNALKESFNALATKLNSKTPGADQSGMLLEIERRFNAQDYRYQNEKKADSASIKQQIDTTIKTKEGISPWYGIAGVVIVLLFFRFVKK